MSFTCLGIEQKLADLSCVLRLIPPDKRNIEEASMQIPAWTNMYEGTLSYGQD